jgi:SAM-dependent methyltransferase
VPQLTIWPRNHSGVSAKPPSSFLRTTFEEVADLYDCARPSYPDELFDDLAVVGELGHGSRVIEIGCGTGQATRPLAERGYQIICVELSEQMAAVARRNLARFGNVEVTTADFETWQPRECAFDAVVAFTALHWIAPEVRYEKSASLLRLDGKLAVVSTHHVHPPGGDDFFVHVQEDYEAILPGHPDTKAGPSMRPDAVKHTLEAEMEASGLFRIIGTRRYLWDVTYNADAS